MQWRGASPGQIPQDQVFCHSLFEDEDMAYKEENILHSNLNLINESEDRKH